MDSFCTMFPLARIIQFSSLCDNFRGLLTRGKLSTLTRLIYLFQSDRTNVQQYSTAEQFHKFCDFQFSEIRLDF